MNSGKKLFVYLIVGLLTLFHFGLNGAVAADTIIDNLDSDKVSSVGNWQESSGQFEWAGSSFWARNGATFSFHFVPTETGPYQVLEWHSLWSSRSESVLMRLGHREPDLSETTLATWNVVNQKIGGNTWNPLPGEFVLTAGETYTVTIVAQPGPSSTCADAVMFRSATGNNPPVANDDTDTAVLDTPKVIDIIANDTDPDGNETIDGTSISIVGNPSHGTATPSNGAVTYTPTIGFLGTDAFSYTVKDDQGATSNAATVTVTVQAGGVVVIIDNLDSGNVSPFPVSAWGESSGQYEWNNSSFWARDGATFSFHFDCQQTGQWEAREWHSLWGSRSETVLMTIEHDGSANPADLNPAQRTVNQKINGQSWNPLGLFNFIEGNRYTVTIVSQAAPSSTSADAVMFRLVSGTIQPPTAEFSGSPLSGDAPLSVSFTDLSEQGDGAITTWSWDFGDGQTSTLPSPVHVYAPGTYTITLTVTDSNSLQHTETKENYITASTVLTPPTANFSGDPLSGDAPLSVSFTDLSEQGDGAITTWSWDFGDGQTSTLPSPVHVYAPGTYTITLTVTDSNSLQHTETKENYITASTVLTPPTANFSGDPLSGDAPLSVSFTDLSEQGDGAITTWSWDFGDGQTSTLQNPSHTYAAGGPYTVALTVTDTNLLTHTETKTDYVTISGGTGAETEHIYFIGRLYNTHGNAISRFISAIEGVGAQQDGDVWKYTNSAQNKDYIIHIVEDVPGYVQAVQFPGAHIITTAHSNYSSGAITAAEGQDPGKPVDVRWIDDDLTFHGTTPFFSIPLYSARNDHGTHFYWYKHQDGTSGMAPFTLEDPADPPPHNYYIPYRVPGNSTYYMFGGGMQKFSGSVTPWFSSTGALPDPTNPNDEKYFITNYSPWSPSVYATDGWIESRDLWSYWGENYAYLPAGTGNEEFEWLFNVPTDGVYKVYARWPFSTSQNTSNATFTVNHADGNTPYIANQRYGFLRWYELGEFNFTAEAYIQDWYESRYDNPLLVSLDQSTVLGNPTKKAKFTANLFGNAYLSQQFNSSQEGTLSISWQILMDSILDDADRDRGGMMLIGTDTGSGPNQGSGSCVYMAFWSPGGGSGGGDSMSLVAREPGDSFDDSTQWREIVSGLSFDSWYDIQVDIDVVSGVYDVYIDGVLAAAGIQFYNQHSALSYISFAQWNDGAGTFYVDNVTAVPIDLLANGDFEASADSQELRDNANAGGTASGSVILTDDTASGNVVADAVRIVDTSSPPIIQADFHAFARYGPAPLEVDFIDQSTGQATGDISRRQWDFGDGTGSTAEDPTHTYTSPGIYTVKLTVTGPLGESSREKVGYIMAGQTAPPVQAEFSVNNQSGNYPLTVSFRDRSTGVTSRVWDFGDGGTSTSSRPSHTYTDPGNYTVTLTINGNVVEEKQDFIRVSTFDKIIDNVDYPKNHYSSRSVLFANQPSVPQDQLKYARMAYFSCSSGPYYAGYYNRGILFYTVASGDTGNYTTYIRDYLLGKSDEEIWSNLQALQPIYDYWNFDLRPDQQ